MKEHLYIPKTWFSITVFSLWVALTMQSVSAHLVPRVSTAQLEKRDAKENVAHNLLGSPPSICLLINSSLGLLFFFYYSADIK